MATLANAYPTRFCHLLADGRVQCDVCPRACALQEGQAGWCFVRTRQDNAIVLRTYGRSSGFCIDPIEKKPLYHFLPGTPILSFGTAGCNLACRFCQNWDVSKSRNLDRLADTASPTAIAHKAAELGCRAVAFTYNDPVVFLEYAIDTARACRALGIKTVAVTAGYLQAAARQALFAEMDAANVDLKSFREEFYRQRCGGHLQPVLETLRYLRQETSVWLEVTTLLIPHANDSVAELTDLSAWVSEQLGPEVPLHFTAFHPDYQMPDTPPTPLATLLQARAIAQDQGLRYVYTGNVRYPAGGITRCHSCDAVLIARNNYTLGAWSLDAAGNCRCCGSRLPGIFEARPGTWGARRKPVRLTP